SGDAVAAVAGFQRVVGLDCRGRAPLLSAVRLDVTADAPATRLRWRVARADARFGKVRIDIDSGCVRGTVEAFLTPRPAPLPSIDAAAGKVAPGEFAAQRAVILGGSRGIGAATAMLVAAGGGVTLETFAAGGAAGRTLARVAENAGRSS